MQPIPEAISCRVGMPKPELVCCFIIQYTSVIHPGVASVRFILEAFLRFVLVYICPLFMLF